jgi:hypothetical protein|tara:strand:+ start:834 stop:1172 length:339 start_codon:yes stop_codon:yes gene_type:complete
MMDDIPDNFMDRDKYEEGRALLNQLLVTPENDEIFTHVNKTIASSRIDSALYLLYVGHRVRTASGMTSPEQELRDFRTLLQTAAALGALVGRERFVTIEKFDRMWNVESGEN